MRRIRLSTLVISLLLLLSALAPIMLAPQARIAKIAKAQGGKSIPITIVERSGNDLANYTVKVELTTGNFNDWDSILYDNGTDVYFTDSQGTPLYYWIEYFNKTEKRATIWVKIPSIPANEAVTIHMYYGGDNPYSDYRNGTETFLLFDDFEGNALDTSKWTRRTSGTVSITIEDSFCKLYSATGTDNQQHLMSNTAFTLSNIGITLRIKYQMRAPYRATFAITNSYSSSNIYDPADDYILMYKSYYSGEASRIRIAINDTLQIEETVQNPSGFVWYVDEIKATRYKQMFYFNGTLLSATQVIMPNETYHVFIGEVSAFDKSFEIWIDWVQVYKYVDPEPYVAVNWTSGIKGSYYVPITIQERSGNNLTDYAVKVVLNSTNFPYWNHIAYWNGSDIYFTDEAGNPLYYWMESFDLDKRNAIIWVKIPSIPANETVTIHMHYGVENPYQDYRNGTETFVFFDDFETDLSKWTELGVDAVSRVTSPVKEGAYALKITDNSENVAEGVEATIASGTKYAVQFYIRRDDTSAESFYIWIKGDDTLGPDIGFGTANYPGQILYYAGGSWHSIGTYSAGTWYKITIFADASTDTMDIYINDVLKANDVGFYNSIPYINKLEFHGGTSDTVTAYIDLVIVRKYVEPEPTYTFGIEIGGAGILLRCFDKLLNKLNYEPLKILLVNKTTGEVIAELTGRYEFFIDSQLPQGTYLIIIKFMGVVLKALEVYFNATARVEVNSTVPALSLLADYRGLSRSFVCNKTIVDVEDLNPKFPYSRSRILVNGTGHFKLFINYQGDLPSGISVSGNVTNLQYCWNGTYLVIEGDLGSIGEVNVTDLYKIRLEIYDRLGNPMPSWIYAYINNTKYTGSTIEDYYYPEDYVIRVPGEINDFNFYGFFDGYNSTVRNITVSDSDVVYKVWYLVATNITMRVSEIAGTATVATWLKQLFARLFQYEEEIETVKSTIDGYVLDYYGNGVPNRRVLVNITNTRTGFTIPLETTTDASGYFSVTADLVRGDTYNITICFLGDDVYADTSASMLYTVSKAVAPAPVVKVPVEYYVIAIAVAIIAVVAIIIAVRGARGIIPYRPRKYVRFKS